MRAWGRLDDSRAPIRLTLCVAVALTLAIMASPADAARWSIEPTGLPSGSTLGAVSCPSKSSCMAVGSGPSGALALSFNGSAWSPTSLTGGVPASISCRGRQCVAVGTGFGATWNGTRWRPTAAVARSRRRTSELTAVYCLSVRNCFAVGDATSGKESNGTARWSSLIEHWNGTRWTIQFVSPSSSDLRTLEGIACTSTASCETVGISGPRSVAEHWNGRLWRAQTTPRVNVDIPPGSYGLRAVSCPKANGCLAVGSWTTGATQHTLAESWNGRKWTIVPSASAGVEVDALVSLSCQSSKACTAVGVRGTDNPDGPRLTLVERWNGARWRRQASPNPSGAGISGFNGVACPTAAWCQAVGVATTQPGSPFSSQSALIESYG